MLLVCCQLQLTFCRPNDMSILKSIRKIIDKYIFQHTSFTVLLLHINIISIDITIKYTFRYVHLWRFLFHGYQQSPQLFLCPGANDILKEKRHTSQKDTK